MTEILQNKTRGAYALIGQFNIFRYITCSKQLSLDLYKRLTVV